MNNSQLRMKFRDLLYKGTPSKKIAEKLFPNSEDFFSKFKSFLEENPDLKERINDISLTKSKMMDFDKETNREVKEISSSHESFKREFVNLKQEVAELKKMVLELKRGTPNPKPEVKKAKPQSFSLSPDLERKLVYYCIRNSIDDKNSIIEKALNEFLEKDNPVIKKGM